jgi:hypothetical protein
LKNHAAEIVSDEAFAKRAEKWTADVPDTKEAYFIRDIFDGEFHKPWGVNKGPTYCAFRIISIRSCGKDSCSVCLLTKYL